jgi:hypothetical protein
MNLMDSLDGGSVQTSPLLTEENAKVRSQTYITALTGILIGEPADPKAAFLIFYAIKIQQYTDSL